MGSGEGTAIASTLPDATRESPVFSSRLNALCWAGYVARREIQIRTGATQKQMAVADAAALPGIVLSAVVRPLHTGPMGVPFLLLVPICVGPGDISPVGHPLPEVKNLTVQPSRMLPSSEGPGTQRCASIERWRIGVVLPLSRAYGWRKNFYSLLSL